MDEGEIDLKERRTPRRVAPVHLERLSISQRYSACAARMTVSEACVPVSEERSGLNSQMRDAHINRISKTLRASATVLILSFLIAETPAKTNQISLKTDPRKGIPVLWCDPGDIATRNLFYGSGGKAHEPQGPFTFEK